MDNIDNSLSENTSSVTGTLDSLTLGQLKSAIVSAPKPKESFYDFKYEDTEDIFQELDEFYSYVEVAQIYENMKSWQGSFPNVWINSTYDRRKEHIDILLEGLEHRNAEVRFVNARRLLYLLQGTFAETNSPEHQLYWIIENSKTVRAANGLSGIFEALKIACAKHDMLCSLNDKDIHTLTITNDQKAELIEELTTELSVYLAMLYTLLEIFRGEDSFSEELMSLNPPLPVFLFNRTAGMRDAFHQNYPIKKWLLVLWKTLLGCWGGIRDLKRVKVLARDLAGLPNDEDVEAILIKSSPLDIQAFQQETSVKYPTFASSSSSQKSDTVLGCDVSTTSRSISPTRLARAYSPIPVRHHYYQKDDMEAQSIDSIAPSHNYHQNGFQPNIPSYISAAVPQTYTPVPTPPPSPKPKKQQYQTDQNRPFLFPFSRGATESKNSSRIPFAIDEADKLYYKHMHVSMAVWQMWKIREECLIAESGLEFVTGYSPVPDNLEMTGTASSGVNIESGHRNSQFEDCEQIVSDVRILESKITETEFKISQMQTVDVEKIKETRADLLRLRRVEQIYAAVLPILHAWALALTKLEFTMVTICNNNQPPPSATSGAFPPASSTEQPSFTPLADEDVDIMRHRELILKAISAILLLTLNWFKVSHVMKFHHLGQLLMDCNGLLMNLKVLVFSEVLVPINSRAESADKGFFRFCQENYVRHSNISAANLYDRPLNHILHRTVNHSKADDNVEVITDFSWRNLFSIINIIKVIHKLSKHRSHRIWMLVHHKCSVVIKKFLKINNPLLQLQVLKLLKNQVPYCGRKWRQSNMKIITQIYLRCRPDLRDEWLTGAEVDDLSDAVAQEQTLRKLVKFYVNKRYGSAAAHASTQSHRRSSSMSIPLEGLHPGPELSAILRPVGTPNTVDVDVFPPLRSQVPDPSVFTPYTTEDIAFEEEYEEFMSDLAYSDGSSLDGPLFGGNGSEWRRLSHINSDFSDGISDSESVPSISAFEGRLDGSSTESDRDSVDENLNNWEHMSPKTMAALPKSPAGAHRRSSSGSSLRPVLPFGLDDVSTIDIDLEDEEEEVDLGPIPREQSRPFAAGAGVDEVEYAYGV